MPNPTPRPPINWIPAIVLISTPILAALLVPYYLWTHTVSWKVWAVFGLFMALNGLGITMGYHRLWSHRTYEAHPLVKWVLLIGGTLAMQNSVFSWCAGHRLHHRHVDDIDHDPYSAKRGFWFSHLGWMLRNYPSAQFDYKNIPDLKADPILVIQDKYYGLWTVLANVGLPLLFGWLVGDIVGTLLLAGLLRLVLSHHVTFFINSLCHMFGRQPYTDTNTARDNTILAFFTWGEGYHNYHHYFQYDYRNGVKWWQYDPTKWMIYGLSKVGLTKNLKQVPDITIRHAQLEMKFKQAEAKLAKLPNSPSQRLSQELHNLQAYLINEQQTFKQTVSDWQTLKTQAIELKKQAISDKLHQVDDKLKEPMRQIEKQFHAQSLRLNALLKRLTVA